MTDRGPGTSYHRHLDRCAPGPLESCADWAEAIGAGFVSVPCSIVAATQGPAADPETLLIWGAVLIGVIVVAVPATRAVRRRWLNPETSSSPDWTLQDLRALRDKGELTDEEFEKLKAAAIAGVGLGSRGPSASQSAARSDP